MKRVFYNCRLFDGLSDKLQDEKILYVDNGKIEKIEDNVQMYDGTHHTSGGLYEAVDLKGLTLLPGFLDLHVHITVPLMNEFKGKASLIAMQKQRALNFRSCIKYGITTVRDMGAFPNSIQEWKKRINSGDAVGPRVYTPNTFITSKDGPPERFPHIPLPVRGFFGGQFAERVSTPQEVRRVALKNIKKNADFLKIQYAETSMFFKGNLVNLSDECFSELKKIAVEHKLKIAMHHTDNAGFKKGIEFGFDCLDHCSLEELNQGDIEKFAEQKMSIVPTLRVNHSGIELDEMLEWLYGKGKEDYAPESYNQILKNLKLSKSKPYPPDNKNVYLDIDKSIRGFENTLRNVNRLKKAGAPIGAGSDCFGCYLNLPGFYWKELELLTRAGLSNFEALRAATIVNAGILGVEKELGSIEVGKLADFTIIDGNPLEDITSVKNVRIVVKDGISYVDGKLEV